MRIQAPFLCYIFILQETKLIIDILGKENISSFSVYIEGTTYYKNIIFTYSISMFEVTDLNNTQCHTCFYFGTCPVCLIYFGTALGLWVAELGFPKMRYGKCT